MRVVPNEQSAVGEGAAAGLLPTAADLERARHLASRFPTADLREVVLVRAPASAGGGMKRVWLALESMQTTGSFKVRGALLAMESMRSAAADGAAVVAASAGNHGIGVACAARVLGMNALIVVPANAPRTKTEKIASYGATLFQAASSGYDDAEAEALELARSRGEPFLSPYDDIDVLVGNGGSLAFEIVRALGKVPDLILCPIGGGGLATGLACGFALETLRRDPGRPPPAPCVWGVQSEASCAFASSLERGAAVTTLPAVPTLAEGLEGGISERGFARARATLAGAIVVTEDDVARAMALAVRELGLVVEGSAAVALAGVRALATRTQPEVGGCTDPSVPIAGDDDAVDVVVVLTGRNVDPERLARVVC